MTLKSSYVILPSTIWEKRSLDIYFNEIEDFETFAQNKILRAGNGCSGSYSDKGRIKRGLCVSLSCFNDHKSLGYRSYLSVH